MADDNLAESTEPFGKFTFNIPITKVDEVKHEVWGTACVEEPDRGDEQMDYNSSKPHFVKWSEDTFKRSCGKSFGNVRAMHQPIAAGIVIDFKADDATKSFPIGTHITDENEWYKCLTGTYTAFSIGGKYGKRWMTRTDDGRTIMSYTAIPNEVSLVDVPAVPHATFSVVKADHSIEAREFLAKDELTVSVNGKMPFGEFMSLALQKLIPGFPKPTNRKAEDETILQYAATTTPQAFTPASVPSTAALQANHPQAQVINPDSIPVSSAMRKYPDGRSMPVLAKEVGDAPGLRHGDPGSKSICEHCKNFRDVAPGYCRLYDFPSPKDWTCDSFTLEDGTGEPDEMAHVAKLTKADVKCPSCGEAIAIEKAGDLKCSACGKALTATDDTESGGFKLALSTPAAISAQTEITDDDAATKMADLVGIAKKARDLPGSLLKGGSDRATYGDPVNKAYACDTKAHAFISIQKFNAGIGADQYSKREWAILGRRLRNLASTTFQRSYRYNPREKQIEREF